MRRHATSGVLEGDDLGRVFAWMRPNDLIWNYWVNNYLLGNDPPAFDLLYWNADTTRLPARLHSDFLDLILHNPLRHPGGMTVAGTPIDLSQVACDSFIVAAPPTTSRRGRRAMRRRRCWAGGQEFVLSSSGHIQSVINPPGNAKAKYFLNPQLPADPEALAGGGTAARWLLVGPLARLAGAALRSAATGAAPTRQSTLSATSGCARHLRVQRLIVRYDRSVQP